MQEEFNTPELKDNFFKVRLRYPQITKQQWRHRQLYIKRQHMMTRDGHQFSLRHYINQWLLQDGKCMICPKKSVSLAPIALDAKKRMTVIDHNHVTNIFRALLCTCCNLFIGKAKESKRRLARAIEYLEEYGHYEEDEEDDDGGCPNAITTTVTPVPPNTPIPEVPKPNPTPSTPTLYPIPNFPVCSPAPLTQPSYPVTPPVTPAAPYWLYYAKYGLSDRSR